MIQCKELFLDILHRLYLIGRAAHHDRFHREKLFAHKMIKFIIKAGVIDILDQHCLLALRHIGRDGPGTAGNLAQMEAAERPHGGSEAGQGVFAALNSREEPLREDEELYSQWKAAYRTKLHGFFT